jgi:glyoxylase-like metal-dependent hydrolase (beta-lactamase superfamily II)
VSGPEFRTLDDVVYGRVDDVSPGVRRVIAKNPSKFTYTGTGTYIVGRGDVVVIDPGPVIDSHRDALAAALAGETVRGILITHCHSDHSPLAAWLAAETGAPTFAVGPHLVVDEPEGMFDGEEELSVPDEPAESSDDAESEVKMEESVDTGFAPDVVVSDGEVALEGPGLTMRAVTTPGHTSNHCCFSFEEERTLFTGDHVMGWSTTVVSPPDGDMRSYIDSLRKVAARDDALLWPTHGPCRDDAPTYVQALVDHRLARTAQIVDLLRASGPHTVPEIVRVLYTAVHPKLHRPAARSVMGHLIELVDDGRVHTVDGGPVRVAAQFAV